MVVQFHEKEKYFDTGRLFSYRYLLVMSRAELDRAIARAEGFSARLGSWPISLQLGIENLLKNELKFQFSVEDLFSIMKLTKLCI